MTYYKIFFTILAIMWFIAGILTTIKSYSIDNDYNNYVIIGILQFGIAVILLAIVYKPTEENSTIWSDRR